MNDKLLKLKNNSLDDDIPIMQDEGLNFLIELIKNKKIKKILEIGTAVGYSAIKMATVSSDIQITTIERDKARYDCARKNIKDFNLNSRINPIFADATELTIDDKYDLIFIDAAKGKNTLFFEKFKNNLNPDGYIVTDNLKFHGCVEKPLEEIESRNVRGLVRKIRNYIEFLKDNEEFETEFFDVGDGISVSRRK